MKQELDQSCCRLGGLANEKRGRRFHIVSGFLNRILPFIYIPSSIVLAWAAGWLAPLEGTWIAHPIWEVSTRRLGASIGACLAIALYAVIHNRTQRSKLIAWGVIVTVVIIALLSCLTFAAFIDDFETQSSVIFVRDKLWRYEYLALCASLIMLLMASSSLLIKRR